MGVACKIIIHSLLKSVSSTSERISSIPSAICVPYQQISSSYYKNVHTRLLRTVSSLASPRTQTLVKRGRVVPMKKGEGKAPKCLYRKIGYSSIIIIIIVAISNLQISLFFPRIIFQWNINVRVSEGSSPRALSNGACNVSVRYVATPT